MKSLLATTALALGLGIPTLLPTLGQAQDFSISAGATLTSRYVASGLEQTEGAALQPWIEAEVSGFYLGLWASNTSVALTGSEYELDVYGGYRNEIGKFSYDVGYARYIYYEPHVNCCGEWYVGMGYAATDQLGIGVKFAFDPDVDVLNSKLTVDYAINDKFGLSATVGTINKGGRDYYSVGGSYAINDNLSISAAWHDTSVSNGVAVVSLDTSFSLR